MTGFSIIIFNSTIKESLNNCENGLTEEDPEISSYTSELDLILEELYAIKENFFLDVLNTYEIENRIISKDENEEKLKVIITTIIKLENEISYSSPNSLIFHLPFVIKNTLTQRRISRLVESIKNIKFGYEQRSEVHKICQELTYLYFLISNGKSYLERNNKLMNSIKLIITSLISLIEDILVDLNNKNQNTNSVLTALICLIAADLITFPIKLHKQEINNFLYFGLFSYSTQISLQKLSAYKLLNALTEREKSVSIECFISLNFDLILGVTFNKLLYIKSYSSELLLENKNERSLKFNKIIIMNLFNSLLIFIEKLCLKDIFTYCGTLNNYIKKLFFSFDQFYLEKEYDFIYYYLEFFLKIAKFLTKYIILLHVEFNQQGIDNEDFANHIKTNLHIEDLNILRNLVLRIRPLILNKNVKITYKSLMILLKLIPVLNLLPLSREDAINFSAEDPANVQISNSLGPIFYETFSYLIFHLKKSSIKIIDLIIDIFISVSSVYSKDFFSESRIFDEILPSFLKGIEELQKKFKISQFASSFEKIFLFLNDLNWKKLIKIKNIRTLYNLFLTNFGLVESQDILKSQSENLLKIVLTDIKEITYYLREKGNDESELNTYISELRQVFNVPNNSSLASSFGNIFNHIFSLESSNNYK